MPFDSGRVSFCRFKVSGDGPTQVDDLALATLSDHAFRESQVGAPDEVESGWITGQHLYDTQFSYEKNGFGTPSRPLLLAAVRLDTHRVPSEVKRSYKQMHENALREQSPSGQLSRAQRREAAELAARQTHEELAAGRYRRSRRVPVLWDLREGVVLCGNASAAVAEHLQRLFQDSFALKLTRLTSGTLAGDWLLAKGRTRDYEDLLPSAYTAPPPEAGPDHEEEDAPRDVQTPLVSWTTGATDLKDFLGNELLIWLWHLTESAQGAVKVGRNAKASELSVLIDRALDMDCAWDARGRMSLRGAGPSRLPEAGEALAHGKWPRKAGLTLTGEAGELYEFTLQAERLDVSSAQLPPIEDVQTPREFLERRLDSILTLATLLDQVFHAFLERRVGEGWPAKREAIREWIRDRRRPARSSRREASAAASA